MIQLYVKFDGTYNTILILFIYVGTYILFSV